MGINGLLLLLSSIVYATGYAQHALTVVVHRPGSNPDLHELLRFHTINHADTGFYTIKTNVFDDKGGLIVSLFSKPFLIPNGRAQFRKGAIAYDSIYFHQDSYQYYYAIKGLFPDGNYNASFEFSEINGNTRFKYYTTFHINRIRQNEDPELLLSKNPESYSLTSGYADTTVTYSLLFSGKQFRSGLRTYHKEILFDPRDSIISLEYGSSFFDQATLFRPKVRVAAYLNDQLLGLSVSERIKIKSERDSLKHFADPPEPKSKVDIDSSQIFNALKSIAPKGTLKISAVSYSERPEGYHGPEQYIRAQASGGMQLAGVPLRYQLLLSSENSYQTPVNRFNIAFDNQRFQQLRQADIQKKRQSEERVKRIVVSQQQSLEKQLKEQQQKLKNLEQKQDSIKNRLNTDYNASDIQIPVINETDKEIIKRVNDSLLNDTVVTLNNLQDTIQILTFHSNNIDTLQNGQLDSLQERINQLRHTIAEIEEKVNYLKDFGQGYQDFNVKSAVQDSIQGQIQIRDHNRKPVERIFSAISGLHIGIFQPKASKFVFSGMGIRGLGLDLDFDNTYISVFGGKLQWAGNMPQLINQQERFTKSLGFSIGKGKRHKNYVSVGYYHFRNEGDILTIESRRQIKNRLSLQAEGGASINQTSLNPQHGFFPTTSFAAFAAEWKQNKLWTSTLKIEHIGARYLSPGAPYRQRGLLDAEFKQSYRFKKVPLQLEGGLKIARVISESDTKSNLKGYSFGLTTSFKRYPNLIIKYMPYEFNSFVGLNREDPTQLVQQSNKYNILLGTLFYSRALKSGNINTCLNYMRSTVDNDYLGVKDEVTSISATTAVQVAGRYTLTTDHTYTKSNALSAVLFRSMHGLGINWQLFKIDFQVGAGLRTYLNNAPSYKAALGVSRSTRWGVIGLEGSYIYKEIAFNGSTNNYYTAQFSYIFLW